MRVRGHRGTAPFHHSRLMSVGHVNCVTHHSCCLPWRSQNLVRFCWSGMSRGVLGCEHFRSACTWMDVGVKTLLHRRRTWAAGKELKLKCQNQWTRGFVIGKAGCVFRGVEAPWRSKGPSQSIGSTSVHKCLHSENSKRSSVAGTIELSIGAPSANVSSRQFSFPLNIWHVTISPYRRAFRTSKRFQMSL